MSLVLVLSEAKIIIIIIIILCVIKLTELMNKMEDAWEHGWGRLNNYLN